MSAQDGRIERAIQALSYQLMRILPTDWASALGSYGVRKNVHLNRPEILAGARRNLRLHRPEASEAELDAMVEEFLDGVGRVMAEFAVMHRFIREGRLEPQGLEAFSALAGTRPIIAFGLHTGNWETFGPMFQHAGIPLASYYMPPESAFDRRVAEQSRFRFGVELLSPDARGIRDGMRLLRQNRVVMIFPDEALKGRALGPLFGRPPHARGNLAIAARLARHTGASFVICHSRRTAPCRFALTFSPLIELPPVESRGVGDKEGISKEGAGKARVGKAGTGKTGIGKADILADVAFLNAHIEPIVRENIPRWYFLDDSIGEIV